LDIKEGDILGFVDETSQNINSNSQRVWSFNELKMKKKTAHITANSIGCFMLNGHDIIAFPDRSKYGRLLRFPFSYQEQ
jgi:hypothetical protein